MASPMKLSANMFHRKDSRITTVIPLDERSNDELGDSDSDDEYIPPKSNDSVSSESTSEEDEESDLIESASANSKGLFKIAVQQQAKWKLRKKSLENDFPDMDETKIHIKEHHGSFNHLTNPMEFFMLFFTDDLINLVLFETNHYIQVNNLNQSKPGKKADSRRSPAGVRDQFSPKSSRKNLKLVTRNELQHFIGITFYMSIVKLPSKRMYWAQGTEQEIIMKCMSRNRFEEILHNLHFNDNNLQPKLADKNYDRLYKIRPFLLIIQKNFLDAVHPETENFIDEMMVPFKGRQKDKLYMPSKPVKWDYKFWVRSGISGYMYEFKVVSGTDPGLPESVTDAPCLIKPSCVDIRLTENLPPGHILSFDNLFLSLDLLVYLKKKGQRAIATFRKNRLQQCPLKTEKELKAQGRGSYDYRVDQGNNVIVCEWYDNRSVPISSNYADVLPIGQCKRRSKTNPDGDVYERPFIVSEYNRTMGGTDRSDMLLAYYRTFLKTRKWYLRIFFHLMDCSVINALTIYRSVEGSMPLQHFKTSLACSLIACETLRRGSFTCEVHPEQDQPNQKKEKLIKQMCQNVYDGIVLTTGNFLTSHRTHLDERCLAALTRPNFIAQNVKFTCVSIQMKSIVL